MKRFAMAMAIGMAALPLLWAQAGATGNAPPQTGTPNTNSQANNNAQNGKPQVYGANPPANPGVKSPIVNPAKGALGNHGNTPANPYYGTNRPQPNPSPNPNAGHSGR